MTKHIIWDWNGTLFHDIDAVVGATNEVFKPYELAPMTADGFRAVYTRPIWVAYERHARPPAGRGRVGAARHGFHDALLPAEPARAALAADAELALSSWTGTQSLCSMAPHAHLVPKIDVLRHHPALHPGRRAARG